MATSEKFPDYVDVVNGKTQPFTATFTRPNDTNAYAPGDVVSDSTSAPTILKFDNIARDVGRGGFITGALMVDSANQTTKGVFELWLFRATQAIDNDNSPFTPTDAEMANVVVVIPLNVTFVGDATSGAGGNVLYVAPDVNFPFACAAADDTLYGVLVVRNGYTPVAQEVFTITLLAARD